METKCSPIFKKEIPVECLPKPDPGFPFPDTPFVKPDYVKDFGFNLILGRVTSNRFIVVHFEPASSGKRIESLVRELEKKGLKPRGVCSETRVIQFECFRAVDKATWKAFNSLVGWLGRREGLVGSAVLEMLFL